MAEEIFVIQPNVIATEGRVLVVKSSQIYGKKYLEAEDIYRNYGRCTFKKLPEEDAHCGCAQTEGYLHVKLDAIYRVVQVDSKEYYLRDKLVSIMEKNDKTVKVAGFTDMYSVPLENIVCIHAIEAEKLVETCSSLFSNNNWSPGYRESQNKATLSYRELKNAHRLEEEEKRRVYDDCLDVIIMALEKRGHPVFETRTKLKNYARSMRAIISSEIREEIIKNNPTFKHIDISREMTKERNKRFYNGTLTTLSKVFNE